MGMNAFTFSMISKVIGQVPHRPVKLVSLGYPDVLLSNEELVAALGKDGAENIAVRPDSDGISNWHGLNNLIEKVPEAYEFFDRLGVELSVMDFKEIRGDELICDLNLPMSGEYNDRFDIVFDGGTLEHCFNVAQAITNILGMAKVGGYIIHGNPLILLNHGFYNFSPTFYYDFYGQNGHELASDIIATKVVGLETKASPLHPTSPITNIPIGTGVFVIVKKQNTDSPVFPTQSKYLDHSNLTM